MKVSWRWFVKVQFTRKLFTKSLKLKRTTWRLGQWVLCILTYYWIYKLFFDQFMFDLLFYNIVSENNVSSTCTHVVIKAKFVHVLCVHVFALAVVVMPLATDYSDLITYLGRPQYILLNSWLLFCRQSEDYCYQNEEMKSNVFYNAIGNWVRISFIKLHILSWLLNLVLT